MERGALDALLGQAAREIGTPCYVYMLPMIDDRAALLRHAFDARFAISFAVKSNPNPALLTWLTSRIAYLDISSIGEFRLARKAGWPAQRLSFTGPAKRDEEIHEAIACGIGELILESVREARVADAAAAAIGVSQDVLIRIAPNDVPKGFGDQMAGRPMAFGIDLEQIHQELPAILALPNLRARGVHIYSGTQCRQVDAIVANYRNFIDIFRQICAGYNLQPAKLVFGSGLGIPYHEGDTPIDLHAVATAINPDLDDLKLEPAFRDTELVLELGRFLVGEAGFFLTRIVSVKNSRGTRIGICDGGMNNHLPASGHFGMVMRRNYKMHRIPRTGEDEATPAPVDLVGPLCTSIDRLASNVALPPIDEGDVIAIHCSGAYGLTASPIHFISHAPPREALADGIVISDVTRTDFTQC